MAWIENFVLRKKHNDKGGGVIMGAAAANATLGYDGSTQTIAIADTGIGGGTAATAHADIAAEPDRRHLQLARHHRTAASRRSSNDGAAGRGHRARHARGGLGPRATANAAGTGKGTAPAARLVFQSIENYATISPLRVPVRRTRTATT